MAAIAQERASMRPRRKRSTSKRRGLAISGSALVVRVLVCLYPWLLILALREVISPVFGYARYLYTPPAELEVVVAVWALAVVPGLLLPYRGSRPSGASLWTLYFLVYVPAIVMPVYASGRSFESYYSFQLALLAGFLIAFAIGSMKSLRLPYLSLPPAVFWGSLTFFTLATFALVFAKYGLPRGVPALSDVYDVRADYAEEAGGQGRLLAYMISWQGKVVNPLMMAHGLVGRRPAMVLTGVTGQLLLYSLAGHKSILFSTLLVLALYIAYWKGGRLLGVVLSAGISAVVIGSAVLDALSSTIIWSSLTVRRMIMTPGMLTGYYHEFFSTNEKTLSFGPISRLFTDYPYDVSVPFLIGREVLDKPNMSANANHWASGYASFGIPGLVIYSVLLGVILLLFNSLGEVKGNRLASILTGVSLFSLTNSSLMTSLGTHGILFALVLLLLAPKIEARRPRWIGAEEGKKGECPPFKKIWGRT